VAASIVSTVMRLLPSKRSPLPTTSPLTSIGADPVKVTSSRTNPPGTSAPPRVAAKTSITRTEEDVTRPVTVSVVVVTMNVLPKTRLKVPPVTRCPNCTSTGTVACPADRVTSTVAGVEPVGRLIGT
jgi:hypothetical protein